MTNKILYSVLRYSPSLVSGESINLGVLFSDANGECRDFVYTHKWKRIQEFDDELDIDFIKLLLESIKNEVARTILNCDQAFNLNEYIQYYTNEINFSSVYTIEWPHLDAEIIKLITKIYLKFDYEKNKRLSKDQELKVIQNILKAKDISFDKNKPIKGKYEENINYDYTFKNYGIKTFNFKAKQISSMMNDVKAWAWNCKNMDKDIKNVFIYNSVDSVDVETLTKMLNILNDATDNLYTLEEGVEFLNNIQ